MKVALIGDVHGNLPALEAVLTDATHRGATAIWHLGDFVGYGPFPEEVVQRIQSIPEIVSIAGNYDLRVLKFPMRQAKWRHSKAADKFFALKWAHDSLSEVSKAYLASLPIVKQLECESQRILLTHGSPEAVNEGLTSDTPDSRLEALAALADADLVACGHSHQAFVRRVNGTLFVNPGGCGRPEGGDPRSCYALIDIDSEKIEVSLERIEYDRDQVVEVMKEQGFPGSFMKMLILGRNLDEVGAETSKLKNSDRIEAVLELARTCDYEAEHTHQVSRIALQIYDCLRELHGLKKQDRFMLECGSLLHDIGWCEGRQAHHKTARRIILNSASLPLDKRERQIVSLIARYHRKAVPREDHAGYCDLPTADQWRVRVLAGILRVADGLDRSHRNVVKDLCCDVGKKWIKVICEAEGSGELEAWGASRKADLLETVFDRKWQFEMRKPGQAGLK